MKPSKISPRQRPVISLKQVAAATLLAGMFFALTNPRSQNSILLILGIVSLGVLLYVWSALLVRVVASLWEIGLRQQRQFIIVMSLTGLFLLLLQSIGQLSWRDVLAVLPFVATLYAYGVYRSKGRATAD